MLKELKGDRREQTGMRENERLSLEVVKKSRGDRRVWKALEKSRPAKEAVGLAYYFGQRHAGMTLRELGERMGEVQYPAASVAIASFQNRLKTERSS